MIQSLAEIASREEQLRLREEQMRLQEEKLLKMEQEMKKLALLEAERIAQVSIEIW